MLLFCPCEHVEGLVELPQRDVQPGLGNDGRRGRRSGAQLIENHSSVTVPSCSREGPSKDTDKEGRPAGHRGPVLGCRVGLLAADALTLVAVHDASGRSTTLKLEGIEPRPGSDCEFDVAIDVDRASAPALLGRLVWEWR